MVFTDQMLTPKSVLPLPMHLLPPTVKLLDDAAGDNEPVAGTFPTSPLGIWYLEGCENFLQTVETALAYHSSRKCDGADKNDDDETEDLYERIAQLVQQGTLPGNLTQSRGRRNLNLEAVPPQPEDNDGASDDLSSRDEARLMVLRLQKEAATVAKQVSRQMEIWLNLPEGCMQRAHAHGKSSSLRLLDYPAGVAVPPHTDGSAYTLVYSNNVMLVQDPQHDDTWYQLQPAGGQLLLMLGSHLDQAIPARLEQKQVSSHSTSNDAATNMCYYLRAPVHRVPASDTPRRALTLHIKADTVWPAILADLNKSTSDNKKEDSSTILSAAVYHARDIAWDAELFSQYLHAKYVPSVEAVQDHWKLLAAIVEGCQQEDDANDCNDDDDFDDSSSPTADSSLSSSSTTSRDRTTYMPFRLPSVYCTGYWQLQTARYLKFLRIHRQYPKEADGMLPPRSIHHVWLCHQLHPLRYQSDCDEFLGRLLDHDNAKFCLEGCPKFHRHWKRVTGRPWPCQAELYKEVKEAESLPEFGSNEHEKVISANLWHNYDGLARLYDEVQQEAPCLMRTRTRKTTAKETSDGSASLLLEEVRLDYARFLVAASYAATINMTVTPSGPVDLVWHTHQTNPKAYQETIQREFPAAPIDHVPCGALNPPPNAGKEWLTMTDEIWMKLFNQGVNVQGHGIHCCTPTNPRPLGLHPSGEDNLIWWFRPPLDRFNEDFIRDFPTTRAAAVEIARLSSSAGLIIDEVLEEILKPLSRGILNELRYYEARTIEMDRKYTLPFCFAVVCLFGIFMFSLTQTEGETNAEGERTRVWQETRRWVKFLCTFSGVLLCASIFWFPVKLHKEKEQQVESFWRRIQVLVDDNFGQQSLERGILLSFRRHELGPIDPDHLDYDRYTGPAIVFRRYQGVDVEGAMAASEAMDDAQQVLATTTTNGEPSSGDPSQNEMKTDDELLDDGQE